MSRLQERMLETVITYIEEDFKKTKNLSKSLDNAKVFLNKTTDYVAEESYGEVFQDFMKDFKKRR